MQPCNRDRHRRVSTIPPLDPCYGPIDLRRAPEVQHRKSHTLMAYRKAAHHRGAHQVTAKRLTTAAYANPLTLCHYCKRTLDKCGPRGDGRNRNGTPCTWQACHVVDGDSRYGYVTGCSHCNQSDGATMGNAKRIEPHSERW